MSSKKQHGVSNRHTGVVIIEAKNSNPNGDIDGNEPRVFSGGDYGWISNACLKRRIFRDALENHNSEAVDEICNDLGISKDRLHIFESRYRGFDPNNYTEKQAMEEALQLYRDDEEKAFGHYWDNRVFGSTILSERDKGKKKGSGVRCIKTGCTQFTIAESLAPIKVTVGGNTRQSPLEEQHLRNNQEDDNPNVTLAHDSVKVVEHAIYVAYYHVTPMLADKTYATDEDIEVLKYLIPYGFQHNPSSSRPNVNVIAAYHAEHESKLGSFPPHVFLQACTPTLAEGVDLNEASRREDYELPSVDDVRDVMGSYKCQIEDLMENRYDVASV